MKKTRKEKGPEFYTGNEYDKLKTSPKMERYIHLYKEAVDLLPKPKLCSTIVDMGCGVGLFTDVLLEHEYTNYLGIDFSKMMLNKARERHPKMTFILGNITEKIIYKVYSNHRIFMLLEVLEHIEKDIDALKGIPSGSLIIFSVPDYDAKSHVRFFSNAKEVISRYHSVLDFSYRNCKQRTIVCGIKQSRIFLFKCWKK